MKSKKCIVCKKRYITNMKCQKCDKIVCIAHRYPEDHMCIYNFNTEGKKQLEKENEKIIAQKVDNI